MLTLRLPDGSAKEVPEGTRPRDVAEKIGKRLAQAAVAAKVNGAIVDLDSELPAGNGEHSFQILTDKDADALDVLRHSCAHVMARAVLRLFPGAQLAFGPTIENGFYYDIDSPTPITEADFPRIEEEMRKIGAFKLLSIAGAYWKNDSSRKQLQRLYGTAFFTQKELDAYLTQLEEAKKRDHRVLGKQLRLFTISPASGSGLILWMPKGAIIRGILETFIKDELIKRGYQPVYTPNIGRLELYRTSGHFPLYKDSQ